jgi:PKHD-type hydroxylase
MYKKISNQTYLRLRYLPSYAMDDTVFTPTEIDKILDYADTLKLMPGLDRGNVRKSQVNFMHPNSDNGWIFDRLNGALDYMNEKYYNFDINGYEFIQYSTYDAKDDGRYNFHMDMALGELDKNWHENRKLSMTLLLNQPGVDFEGGEFEINTSSESQVPEKINLKKGKLILFPSFLIHRVRPVTKGIRKSLVIWLTGPKFR